MINKILPNDTDREKSVLCSCMIFPDQLDEVADILEPGHFYKTAHSYIFRAILDLKHREQPADLKEVVLKLKQAGNLEKTGGASCVAGILDNPSSVNPRYDTGRLIDFYNLRKIIQVTQEYQNKAFSGNPDEVESIIDGAQSEILKIGSTKRQKDFKKVGDLVCDAVEKYQALQKSDASLTGIPSGFIDIDRLTCGFQSSDLVLFAARPSMGKTAFAISSILGAAKQGVRAGIFSLEMANSQLINRMMAGESGLNSLKFRSGNFSPDNWTAINNAAAKLYNLPVFIDDSPSLTFQQIIRKTRKLKQQEDIQIVWIDYLGFIRGNSSKPRVYEVGEISRELKGLAKSLDMPVILLCQLNRQCEQRDNKRPRMSDLRESGDLEQDADIVAFLYRHEQYLRPKPEPGAPEYVKWHGRAELEFAKNRNGPTGTIYLHWDEKTTKFSNYSAELDQNENPNF